MRNERPYLIESVDNALQLLLLVRERRALRVTDAASHLGVARSTAHRLLTGLRYRGFVTQDAQRVYRPGPWFTYDEMPDLRLRARPHLYAVRRTVDESVYLSVLEGNSTRFIEVVQTTRALRVDTRAGILLPAHCTASGLVLLAGLPTEEVAALYPRGLPSFPGTVATTLSALFRRLRIVRRTGFAHNDQESDPGLVAVAVPVRDAAGHTLASLALAMPAARCPRARAVHLAGILRAHADAITGDL